MGAGSKTRDGVKMRKAPSVVSIRHAGVISAPSSTMRRATVSWSSMIVTRDNQTIRFSARSKARSFLACTLAIFSGSPAMARR